MYIIISQSGDAQSTVALTLATIGARAVGSGWSGLTSVQQGEVQSGLQNYNPQIDWIHIPQGVILFVQPVSGVTYAGAVVNMLAPTELGLVPALIGGLQALNQTINTDLNNAISTRTNVMNNYLNNPAYASVFSAAGLTSEVTRLDGVINSNNSANSSTLSQFPVPLALPGILQTVINDLTTWGQT